MTYAIGERKWGETVLGRSGGLVTWSISFVGLNYNTSLYDVSDFEAAIADAFQDWEDVADIDFEPATSSEEADIYLYFTYLSGSTVGLATYWYIPTTGIDEITYAEIEFDSDPSVIWSPYGETSLSFYGVALHEIGHVIGLEHVSDSSEIMNPVIYANGLGDGDITGAQILYGTGTFVFVLSNGSDVVDYSAETAPLEIYASGGNDTIYGGSGGDTILGGLGLDALYGNAGDDILVDTLGESSLFGGADNDLIVGGFDTIIGSGGDGDDRLVGGIGDDNLSGDAGNDVLRGDPFGSFFYGSDVLDGGTGNDLLEGGGGADVFIFLPNDGTDTIGALNGAGTAVVGQDFDPGIDLIDLTGFGFASADEVFAAITDVGGNAVFASDGTQITIFGVTEADLSNDDFLV